MTRIAVGCPIHHREWSLPRWFEAIRQQDMDGVHPVPQVDWAFAFSDENDPSLEVIDEYAPYARLVDCSDLPSFTTRTGGERYRVLAEIRNRLLAAVRGFDYFWSIDSDIIPEPGCLRALLSAEVDCAGALLDMLGESVSQVLLPSAMRFISVRGEVMGERLTFDEVEGEAPIPVDIVMANVLLSRRAVRAGEYRYANQGEDIGFCMSLREAGIGPLLIPAARAVHLYDGPLAGRNNE